MVKELDVSCDYLVHCVSVTKSAEMISHPVEVIESIVNVAQNVLEIARRCGIQSINFNKAVLLDSLLLWAMNQTVQRT